MSIVRGLVVSPWVYHHALFRRPGLLLIGLGSYHLRMSLERKSNDSDRSIPDKHFLAYKQNVIRTADAAAPCRPTVGQKLENWPKKIYAGYFKSNKTRCNTYHIYYFSLLSFDECLLKTKPMMKIRFSEAPNFSRHIQFFINHFGFRRQLVECFFTPPKKL